MAETNSIALPPRAKDLTGHQFCRWTVLKYVGRSGWLCRCECGTTREVFGYSLTSGVSKSCGCLNRERSIARFTTHGKRKSPEYSSWQNMLKRCFNHTNPAYDSYGGRGITVCERWRYSFAAFYEDMGDRPSNTSLGRIDNDGNYEPGNCAWETPSEQARNRRSSRYLKFRGQTKLLVEWSEEIGMSACTLRARLNLGWSVERALAERVHR